MLAEKRFLCIIILFPYYFRLLHIQEAETDLDMKNVPTQKGEIITALRSLKKGKAPGQDNLNADMFKADPETSAKILQPLSTLIWEGKKVPENWNKDINVTIHMKGASNNCNNWRGIILLSIPSKILAKIIKHCISDAKDKQLRKEQAGFRKGSGRVDQILSLRNTIEQCTEWQRQLSISFIDFEKACDSIHCYSVWHILRAYGIPQQIVLIKSFCDNFTCKIGDSEYTSKVNNVRQECVISVLLFNLVIDQHIRRPYSQHWRTLPTQVTQPCSLTHTSICRKRRLVRTSMTSNWD